MDVSDKPVDPIQESPEGRRRLLRAMAAVGAGAPGVAFAGTRPYCQKAGTNYHASASAVGSMIGSNVGTATPKWGYTCSHYKNPANWNFSGTCNTYAVNWNNCGNTAWATKTKFYALFGCAQTTQTNRDCADILQNDNSSDEAYWLCAVFNACKVGSNFPYTATEITKLYKSQNPWMGDQQQAGLNTKALNLFKNYLSAV